MFAICVAIECCSPLPQMKILPGYGPVICILGGIRRPAGSIAVQPGAIACIRNPAFSAAHNTIRETAHAGEVDPQRAIRIAATASGRAISAILI